MPSPQPECATITSGTKPRCFRPMQARTTSLARWQAALSLRATGWVRSPSGTRPPKPITCAPGRGTSRFFWLSITTSLPGSLAKAIAGRRNCEGWCGWRNSSFIAWTRCAAVRVYTAGKRKAPLARGFPGVSAALPGVLRAQLGTEEVLQRAAVLPGHRAVDQQQATARSEAEVDQRAVSADVDLSTQRVGELEMVVAARLPDAVRRCMKFPDRSSLGLELLADVHAGPADLRKVGIVVELDRLRVRGRRRHGLERCATRRAAAGRAGPERQRVQAHQLGMRVLHLALDLEALE